MEQASIALVERRYFEAERLALTALRKAHVSRDYERMARIAMPLQEARRQKRDLAYDAAMAKPAPAPSATTKVTKSTAKKVPESEAGGGVFVVTGEIPSGKALVPGCYLVSPPRVGLDGRMLRESADKREVPVIVTVREPESRDGLWPLVALGPVTIRTKVEPPPQSGGKSSGVKGSAVPPKGKAKDKAADAGKKKTLKTEKNERSSKSAATQHAIFDPPDADWFLTANEALGDAAIASIPEHLTPHSRVDALMERLEAMPDHEKLHQHLADAAREAFRTPMKPAQMKKRPASAIDDEADDDESGDDEE